MKTNNENASTNSKPKIKKIPKKNNLEIIKKSLKSGSKHHKSEAKVAVLIPCYNEEVTIYKVITDYKEALKDFKNLTIYVFDNNSSDDTIALAKKAGATVYTEELQGKGNVIRQMFRTVQADAYLMIDGDDTYDAKDAKTMIDYVLDEHYDMVIGDRLSGAYFTENKRAFHNFGNVLVQKLINTLFAKKHVNDIMTGMRAFSYGFVKTFPVLSDGFQVETEMTIHALDKDMRLKEVTIEYRDRPDGSESKLNTVNDGIKVLWTIFDLIREYKPLGFFTFIAALFEIIGLGLFARPMIEFVNTGLVTHFPTLIVSVLFIIVGIQFQVTAYSLDLTCKKHRQLFETNLNIINSTKH
ncbi:MAG: glycosyltransferase family 2 protein [Bifidobacteriaceae bacterium]|jgi:glycosyltransferase involved in cell wall biosynthesis|nr:glycosyltransferase family 2 protein [Bifidobacteriaceae bacterium]